MGAKYLQQILNEHLGKHIKEKLPGIRTRIQQKTHDLRHTLQDLGYSEESTLDKSKLMYKLLDRFAKDLETQLEGNGLDINVKTLKAGALTLMSIYGQIYPIIESAVSSANQARRTLQNIGGQEIK